MNLVILIGLVVIGISHALRGTIAVRATPGPVPGVVPRRRVLLPACGAALSLAGLLVGWSAELPVPVGYAGGAGGLALDPLGCAFALLLFLAAAWCDAEASIAAPSSGLRDLRVAASLLAFLAGDAFLLACGACLACLLPQRLLGRRSVRLAVLAAFSIAGACSLLSGQVAPVGGLLADPGFVLLRAAGGMTTLLLPALVLLAAMPLLGLWPMSGGFRHRCEFAPVWVPITGMVLGQFLLLRLLLDLAGPVVSPQWGVLLVLLGAGSALRAGLAGLAQQRASGVVGSVLAAQNGLGVVAVGLCLQAHCNDLPVLAGSALDAALLLAPASVLGGFSCLALLRAMEGEAGSGLLGRLGGLVRSMPRASLTLLLPLALLGAVPPLTGFAVLWLLVQLVLATPLPMLAGVAVPSLLLLLSVACVAGLNGACLLRLGTVVLLGRPRTPRGAAATDLGPAMLRRQLLLLGLPVLVGLLPGAWLRLVAGRGAETADISRHAVLWLDAPAGNAVFSPLPVALLLATCLVGALLFARVLRMRPERRQRGWEGGAPPPPAWLPFGDPATQIAPATLHLSLQQALDLPSAAGAWSRLGVARAGRAGMRVRRARRFGGILASALLRHGAVLAAAVLAVALCAVAAGTFSTPGPVP